MGYPRETVEYTFYNQAEGKTFVAKTGTFLEKDFLAKGVSGRKVELDEIVDPELKIPSNATKVVPETSSTDGVGKLSRKVFYLVGPVDLGSHQNGMATWFAPSC